MIKRVVEISGTAVHVAVEQGQLLIKPRDGDLPTARVPCEDLGVLVVDHVGVTYSHQALSALMDSGAAVLLCGSNHLPAGYLLPYPSHGEVITRIHRQISAGLPLKKRLWRRIIAAKIRAQAGNVAAKMPQKRLLLGLAAKVRSGDPSNMEAQAAKVYWKVWLGEDGPFRRDPDGEALNGMLNYGYAVVRAAVARAIVAVGLLPMLGIHHGNRSNAFCLADDLIEPLRPLVDAEVRQLSAQGKSEIDKDVKARLLTVLNSTVLLDNETMPLQIAIKKMLDSLNHCYERNIALLRIPVRLTAAESRHGIE